jgi:hypothetical protein
MDIALVLDTIRPAAAYRRSATYDELVATWEDESDCPTLGEIEAAWLSIHAAELCRQIDQHADRVRAAIVGDPVRVVEYQRAEQEAAAYRAAGYNGIVPPTVLSWAEAKGWDALRAADDILAVAAVWNQALYVLRDARLKGKEAVRGAVDETAAAVAASAAIAQIQAVLTVAG